MNGKDVRIGAGLLVDDIDSMVRFYRDTLGFHTEWTGGDFAEFETASGLLSLFMYSRKEFVKAIGGSYIPPKGINQTFEIALWLPSFADVDMEYERLSKLGLQFPTGEPITYPFAFATFMLPTLREIYLKSVVRMKHKFPVISECKSEFERCEIMITGNYCTYIFPEKAEELIEYYTQILEIPIIKTDDDNTNGVYFGFFRKYTYDLHMGLQKV